MAKGCCVTGNEKDGYQISKEFVEQMVEAFREQKRLHRRFAFIIIREVDLSLSYSTQYLVCKTCFKIQKAE